MPVQLQYVELITDRTNAADLLSSVFAILTNSATWGCARGIIWVIDDRDITPRSDRDHDRDVSAL